MRKLNHDVMRNQECRLFDPVKKNKLEVKKNPLFKEKILCKIQVAR